MLIDKNEKVESEFYAAVNQKKERAREKEGGMLSLSTFFIEQKFNEQMNYILNATITVKKHSNPPAGRKVTPPRGRGHN